MPIWIAAPAVFPSQWRCLETEESAIHLVGLDLSSSLDRVGARSSVFGPAALQLKTRFHRIYPLTGAEGRAKGAEYAWKKFRGLNGFTSYPDVTAHLPPGALK